MPAGARGFRVIEQVGVTEKVLRKALAAHDCGPLEILVRGLDVDPPDQLRKKLKPKGGRPLSVVLTRIGRKGDRLHLRAGHQVLTRLLVNRSLTPRRL